MKPINGLKKCTALPIFWGISFSFKLKCYCCNSALLLMLYYVGIILYQLTFVSICLLIIPFIILYFCNFTPVTLFISVTTFYKQIKSDTCFITLPWISIFAILTSYLCALYTVRPFILLSKAVLNINKMKPKLKQFDKMYWFTIQKLTKIGSMIWALLLEVDRQTWWTYLVYFSFV